MKVLFLLLLFELSSSAEGFGDIKIVGLKAIKGFPFAIKCFNQGNQNTDSIDDKDEVQCLIKRNGKTLLNVTSTLEDIKNEETFEIADDSWNKANISVYLRWSKNFEGFQASLLTLNLIDPETVKTSPYRQTIFWGEEETLFCTISDTNGLRMSESQFNSTTSVWYYGDVKIERDNPNFEYGGVPEYTNGRLEFEALKIRNASLRTTPGNYHCKLQFKNEELTATTYEVCICPSERNLNLPDIVAGQVQYSVTPGSTINITCVGHTGTKCKSASQRVTWSKYKDINGTMISDRKCSSRVLTPYSKDKDCSSILHGKRCAPFSVAEGEAEKKFDDSFAATYTLRNVTLADSGLYACTLRTTRGPIQSNITVVVEESLEGKTNKLTVALAAVFGCLVVAVILLLLCRIYMTPIHYFFKKNFAPYETRERQYVAYMVYAADVFENRKNNMLEDTYQYFSEVKQLIYDPNNNAGEPISDTVIEVLERCMTAVLFVTPQLLDNIDNGDNEINEVYRALERNIATLNMRLVFICSEETRKSIMTKAAEGNEFCVMLRAFIGRKGNNVILWRESNQKSFSRALYVAMPKVKTKLQTIAIQNEAAV